MSGNAPALLAAAAGVGLGHAVLPDHWVPLAVLGRTRRYPLSRIARLSGLAGVAHVLVSLILGALVIAVGLQFRATIQSAQDTVIGCILIATGVGFAIFEAVGTGHGHPHAHTHHHGPEHAERHDAENPEAGGRARRLAGVMVPFGAAASPDLTILPVFLAATAAGTLTAVGALLVFAAVTIATVVLLTVLAAKGGYEVKGRWLDRWGNVLTAGVLVAIGVLVLIGTV